MKDLQSVLKLLIVALVAAVVLGAVLSARATAREYYAYRSMVAPKTIHQMVLEMEAADEPERGPALLYGAGLLALAGLVFGGMLFAMHGGTALLKERRLGRKKSRTRRPASLPAIHTAPLLREAFPPNENYANDSDGHRG